MLKVTYTNVRKKSTLIYSLIQSLSDVVFAYAKKKIIMIISYRGKRESERERERREEETLQV